MSRATSMPARLVRANEAAPRPRRLTKTQLKKLERELRRECAQLERTLAKAAGASTPLMSRRNGFPTLDDTDGGLPVMLEARTLGRHESVVAALRRLETGTYGQCLGCDRSIHFERLSVMPEATHCIACGSHA
jgi:DnaK suppressor protein